jgi:uncharacterized repeat protein (TIGR01451 family)
VFQSIDGGAHWSRSDTGMVGAPVLSLAIAASNTATLYAGTTAGVFKSTNGGITWFAQNSGLLGMYVNAVAVDPSNSDIVYAATGSDTSGTLCKSENGGGTWTSVAIAGNRGFTSLAIHPLTPQHVYAGTSDGYIAYSFNGFAGYSLYDPGHPHYGCTVNVGITRVNALAIDPAADALYAAVVTDSVWVYNCPTYVGQIVVLRKTTNLQSCPGGLCAVYYYDGDGPGLSVAVSSSGTFYAGRTSSILGAANTGGFVGPFRAIATDPFAGNTLYIGINGPAADAFLTVVNPAGTALVSSSYFGGRGSDEGRALAVDTSGNAWLAGVTSSPDFPATPGARQAANAGGADAFVAKFHFALVPVLSISKTHVGNFAQGQNQEQGGWTPHYVVMVSNAGSADTSGTVTVTETVPSGLTLVSMAGSGWTCPAGGTTCTRSDPLNGGVSYPAITVLVNVAWNAGTPLSNSVSVSGGGSASSSTSDSTVISANPPVLSIGKSHTGSFAQGQNGAAYTVTVSNTAGAGPTSGPVMVTETVPSGMTMVSMAGTGWTCPGTAANNCTRSNVLNGGASYPAIMVTVNVASSASSQLTNHVSVSGGGSGPASTGDLTLVEGQALRFVPITPCRIADTRNATGAFGGPAISTGTSRDFTIPNSACGVPSTAQAYSLNVAVVPSGRLGYLTLWPTGQTRPLASTLNSLDGRIKSNAAIVPAGTGGAVSVFASDATNVILDINGYFVLATDPSALAFYPVTPCRIADTRTATAPLGGPSLGGGTSRTFPILSSTCSLPATAQAYSLNFAAVPGGHPLGYLTAWPTGQTRPVVASLNAPTGTVAANAAIVKAGTNGAIDIFASDATNLVIDINGYFAPMSTGGLSLYGMTPCRVLDTRQPAGSPPITSLDVAVSASACGIPSNAQAHVLSVAVVPPGSLGYLTLWPQGQARPVVATLNALDGAITSNLAIVPTTNGSISAFASDPTHLILDISGYFGQ